MPTDVTSEIGVFRSARLEEAAAEMPVIGARLRQAHAVNSNIDIRIVPLVDHVNGYAPRSVAWFCRRTFTPRDRVRQCWRRELAVRSALRNGQTSLLFTKGGPGLQLRL
jgi:hypothetical protein